MKIFLHSSSYLDLEAPINMTLEQYNVFERFFKENFPMMEFINRIEKIKKTGSRDSGHKDWTIDDYLLLLEPIPNGVLARKMGRTDMSIKMKRGQFVPDFFVWMKKKGYSLPVKNSDVKDFFDDQGEA